MVRAHGVDVAGEQFAPQGFLHPPLPQRGRAFEGRADALGVLVGEVEVVGAGLDGHVDAPLPALEGKRHRPPGGDVDEVKGRARLLGEEERAPHRLDFGDHRAGLEVVAHALFAPAPRDFGEAAGEFVALGVGGDDPAPASGEAHSFVEREVVGGGKLVEATVGHECLETDHTGFGQAFEVAEVQRGQPTPQREVDQGFLLAEPGLFLKALTGEQRRRGVEGHVEKGGRAARRERPGASLEALPVGAARLVEVDVGIDDAGKDV